MRMVIAGGSPVRDASLLSRRFLSEDSQFQLLAVRSTVSGFFAVLIHVADGVLIDEQVRTTVTRELDAIPVIPFHGSVQDFPAIQHHRNRCARLHLFYEIEVFRKRLIGRRRLFARRRGSLQSGGLRRPRNERFFWFS